MLRGLEINRVNQVWATDIAYIPMARGFLYLVTIMDWHSRYVLAWRLSPCSVTQPLRKFEPVRAFGRPARRLTKDGEICSLRSLLYLSNSRCIQIDCP